jgi:hypothetical protein
MRTVRIVASTLAVAALGVVGSQSGALASQATETCTHGIAYDNSSHKRVEYLGSRTTDGQHIHSYRHITWTGIGNHTRDVNCDH